MTKPTHLLTIGFALTTALAATAGCRQPAPQPKADKVIVVNMPPARLLTWQQQILLPAWSAREIAVAAARQPSPI